MAEKQSKFTVNDNDRLIASALKGTDGLTIAEVNEKLGSSLLPVHFNHAAKGGFIEKVGEKEVMRQRPSPVCVYYYINSDIATDAKGNPCNYSDAQNAILAAARGMEGDFILSELADAMGIEKVAPGSVTSLVNRGNLGKREEKRTVYHDAPTTVAVWGFVKDAE
jgi:hypothetical protein